jgi:hypothetical protein
MAEKTAAEKAAEEAQKKREQDAREKNEREKQQAQQNQHRESKTQAGMSTTYSGGQGKAPDIDWAKENAYSRDEIKGFVGDVFPGELAHISLDEQGTPTGAAFKEIPAPDDITAPVYAAPQVIPDDLVTPAGAPITRHMNPDVAMWDAGMLARNPPPEGGRPGDKPKGPIGGGVRNTPVTA